MKPPPPLRLSLFLLLFYLPIVASSQDFFWDKTHTCRIRGKNSDNKYSFSYTGDACKNETLNGKTTVKIYQDTVLLCTITGNFSDGYVDGYAEYTWPNGTFFKGTVQKDIWKYGQISVPKAYVYTGEFGDPLKKGQSRMFGLGKIVYSDGDSFEGDFYDNLPTINGIWYFKDGSKCVGMRHLSSKDNLIGMYYSNAASKTGELRRMTVTNNYKPYYYYKVEILSTPGESNEVTKAMAKDLIEKIYNYIKMPGAEDKKEVYEIYGDGILNKRDGEFYPMFRNNWYIETKNGETFIIFNRIIYNKFGNESIAHRNPIKLDEISEYWKGSMDSRYSKDGIDNTNFLRLEPQPDPEKRRAASKFLHTYLNQTGTGIKYGYFVNPQLVDFDRWGINFYLMQGLIDSGKLNVKKIPSDWPKEADNNFWAFERDIKAKTPSIEMPWDNIQSFQLSNYDVLNNGYWLTIYGTVIRREKENEIKIADSHTVFVQPSFARLLLFMLNWIKYN